jgi:predicted lipid-binding transport protein (Tim44 family)
MGFFDIYSVIFLVIAVAIFWKLRSVLGTRTGSEKPPVNRWGRNGPPQGPIAGPDNVVPLPRPLNPPTATPVVTDPSIPDAMAPSALDEALRLIAQADRGFDQSHFLGGAKAAYEMIVTAFATGDRRTLKPLLSKEVYDSFAGAMDERERLGHMVETKFVGIDRAEIIEARLKGGIAEVTVRFSSQLITATLDQAGTVVDGDANRVTDVIDIWTFSREISSSDPNWRLVSTDNG